MTDKIFNMTDNTYNISKNLLTINDDIDNIIKNLPEKMQIIFNLSNYDDVVKQFETFNTTEQKNFIFILNYCYHVKGDSLVKDYIFDKLIEDYPQFDVDLFENKVILPYPMPSLKKVYPENKKLLLNLLRKFVDSCVNISSKLDGVSCLLVKNKNEINIYTKGNGIYGRNITCILKHINIDLEKLYQYKKKLALRGELIIKKKNFTVFNNTSSFRSQIIGLINQKQPDENLLKYIDIVFYEVKYPIMSKMYQLNFVSSLNLNVVKNISINISNISNIIQFLTSTYKQFFDEEDYEIDGLVISDYNTIIENNFEDFIFAFKVNTIFAITDVVNIQWSISKDFKYIPKIIVVPVNLNKIIVSKISGFNASYIFNNKIGIGAIIKIKYSGNVIPVIDSVIKESENIPIPNDVYWDKNKTHLLSKNKNNTESIAKQLEKFYIVFKIKLFGYLTIKKILLKLLTKRNINDIFDYIDTLVYWKNEVKEKILGVKKDNDLYDSLEIFKTKPISITSLLVATNKFILIDETKLLNIFKYNSMLADIIIKRIPLECISIKDFENFPNISTKTATNLYNGITYFMNNKEKFEDYFNINYNIIMEDKILKVVFSNISAKQKLYLEPYLNYFTEYISVRKDTPINYLVTYSLDGNMETEKIRKAERYNIPVISLKDFINKIKLLKK